MNEAARHRLIDLLRGSASIAVVLFHLNELYPALSDPYHRVLKFGWLGVPVFFVISGFCIAAARPKDGLAPFCYRRFLRLFPPYWASLFLVLAVVALRLATFGVNDVSPLPKSLWAWVCTFAALTSPATSVHAINWVYWSLSYEVAFYIIMAILGAWRFGLLLLPFSILALFLPGYPFHQWGLFALGIACYQFTKKQYRLAIPLALLSVVHLCGLLSTVEAIAGTFTALLILFPPAFALRPFLRPLATVGLFSYSLYLIHVPIGCYLLARFLPWLADRRFLPSLVHDLLILAGCLLAAYVFYRLIEKPSHELARRITRHPSVVPAKTELN